MLAQRRLRLALWRRFTDCDLESLVVLNNPLEWFFEVDWGVAVTIVPPSVTESPVLVCSLAGRSPLRNFELLAAWLGLSLFATATLILVEPSSSYWF